MSVFVRSFFRSLVSCRPTLTLLILGAKNELPQSRRSLCALIANRLNKRRMVTAEIQFYY